MLPGIMGLPYAEESIMISLAASIQYRSVTDGRTDGRTDRITISISHVSIAVLTRDKNSSCDFTSAAYVRTVVFGASQ